MGSSSAEQSTVEKSTAVHFLRQCRGFGDSDLHNVMVFFGNRTGLLGRFSSLCSYRNKMRLFEGELDWRELLNVDTVEADAGVTQTVKSAKGQRSVLTREHLHGLLEVEPLSFSCQTASDGVRVENLETGLYLAVWNSAEELCFPSDF